MLAAKLGITQILLLANLILLIYLASSSLKSASVDLEMTSRLEGSTFVPSPDDSERSLRVKSINRSAVARTDTAAPGIGSTDSGGFYFFHPREGERNFYKIGKTHGTDKVTAPGALPGCIRNDASCTRPSCVRPECRPWGHHYDTIYQQRLGPFSRDDVDPFQFLEIGFYNGGGYDTVSAVFRMKPYGDGDIFFSLKKNIESTATTISSPRKQVPRVSSKGRAPFDRNSLYRTRLVLTSSNH